MSESLLTVLKLCFLALLYLFLARVVRVVVLEMRDPAPVLEPVAPPESAGDGKRAARGGYELRVLEPKSRKGELYPVSSELTIGRAGGCAIVVPDDTFVSQVHARLSERDGGLWIEDVGSTNGTFVNGERIETPVKLRKGDRVQMGATVLEAER